MNVGFYFHVPAAFGPSGDVRLPANIGAFVDELAAQAGRVTLYAHSSPLEGTETHLLGHDVHAIDIGPRRSFPARTFLPRAATRHFRLAEAGIDVMLVRGPTPLLPSLVRASRGVPVAMWLQGDYRTGPLPSTDRRWRRALMRVWRVLYTMQQRRVSGSALVMTNGLAPSRRPAVRGDVLPVFASALTEDVVESLPSAASIVATRRVRTDGPRLLYVGRIVEEKGLIEAVDAVRILRQRFEGVRFDIVGNDDGPFADLLRKHISGLSDAVCLRGHIPVGPRLMEVYQDSDAFVLPSYHEGGVPYVLIEALACAVPVVATRVGGIPAALEDGRRALLVDRSPVAIADAIERILLDPDLAERLAIEGSAWAREHTLERSCSKVVSHLSDLVDRRNRHESAGAA